MFLMVFPAVPHSGEKPLRLGRGLPAGSSLAVGVPICCGRTHRAAGETEPENLLRRTGRHEQGFSCRSRGALASVRLCAISGLRRTARTRTFTRS